MLKEVLLVFAGGGLGSSLRFLIGRGVLSQFQGNFPLGTLISNVIACILLAFVVSMVKSRPALHPNFIFLFISVGFCGGLSTFSTFSLESLQLFRQGLYWHGILNILISLSAGLISIYLIISKYPTNENP